MVQSTIMQQMSASDRNYYLAFEASETDRILQNKLSEAYMMQDFGKATKIDRIARKAHERLNRRYNRMVNN